MDMQILKLVIWPKSKSLPPRQVDFKPNCLNVITGASRTGKSAIIPIIDYCLASSDCFIPIDTIRDHASWYGVVLQTTSEQVLIARKVPVGNKVSREFYLSRSKVASVPTYIDGANEKIDGVKQVLNTISSVPYFSLSGESGKSYFQSRLGFRDLMALVFQSQEIVANQNILFYKTHATEHKERLRNWFPYILGAESTEVLSARQQLAGIEKRLNQLKRESDKASTVSNTWMSNLREHITVAEEYGLYNEKIDSDILPEELLEIAKGIVDTDPDFTNLEVEKSVDTKKRNERMKKLEDESEAIAMNIGLTKKRLNDISKLKDGMYSYGDSVKRRVNRLQLSQWLESVSGESSGCPACGGKEHPKYKEEIKRISSAFRDYESKSKAVSEIPTSFDREENILKERLAELIISQKSTQGELEILLKKNKEASKEFYQRKSMFQFLGHLKASVETFESLIDGGEFNEEINELQADYNRLSKIVDPSELKRKLGRATKEISQKILKYLQGLDVDSKYKKVAPDFSVKELNISVQSDSGDWHFLAEVGSASNWVSYHLALMCALQEYFSDLESSSVPSFVIFDQPSQVYFPKVSRTSSDEEIDHKIEDEDVDAVRSMFETISNCSTEFKWQSIILDHADESIYGDIDNVHEVETWRNGEKLIPEHWYK